MLSLSGYREWSLCDVMLLEVTKFGIEKGGLLERGLFKNVHYLERDSRDSKEPPESGQRRI